MIIACPQCDTRFVVPSTVFNDGGRKVRCASCKHEWFQDKPVDEGEAAQVASEEEDFRRFMAERVSESRVEKVEDVAKPSSSSGLKDDFTKGAKVIIAACVTVLFIFFGYQMLQPGLIAGEGLAFNNLVVERNGETIVLNGEIVNTVNEKRAVPSMKITTLLLHDAEGDVHLVAPDKNVLESGEVLPINVTLDHIGSDVQSLSVTFAGNNTHSNEHEEAIPHEESHAAPAEDHVSEEQTHDEAHH